MQTVRIRETLAYAVDSTGKGTFYTLTRKADGASVCFQGDDADIFRQELRKHDLARPGTWAANLDNIAEQYDGVMQIEMV